MREYKELCCRDVGVDCDFTARGATIEEVVQQCVDYGVKQHGMKGFGRELYTRMLAHVRTIQNG